MEDVATCESGHTFTIAVWFLAKRALFIRAFVDCRKVKAISVKQIYRVERAFPINARSWRLCWRFCPDSLRVRCL